VVGCLSCNFKILRQALQPVLLELNPQLAYKFDKVNELRPDGDVDLTLDEVGLFKVPPCPKCHTGVLKPCVVFFGDNVPKDKVILARTLLSQSNSVLIIGSSLQVFSGKI
jgi:NAD-dependent SIR2 family protein deacetylase